LREHEVPSKANPEREMAPLRSFGRETEAIHVAGAHVAGTSNMSRVDHRSFTSVLPSEVTLVVRIKSRKRVLKRNICGGLLTHRDDPEHKVPENDVCVSSHLHLLVLSRCSLGL
jgi:hypothetical protein